MRWPHHSWRLTHQSRMFSSHLNHVDSNSAGMISRRPSRTASQPSAAICLQSTHHCGLSSGSITSLEREHSPRRMVLGSVPRYSPFSFRNSVTVRRASKRACPSKGPPRALILPTSSKMLMNSRLWRLPVAKSLGSCAGVILTQPVPKAMSTSSASQMMGILRPSTGCTTNFPCRCLYLSSSGWMATPVSPSMVSMRVVATTTSPSSPSSG
mmetsp:Transcript_3935/g.9912  ORF Transcript_3935/g.9912 Transcript_3935/m.9912 type:complete len:211 (+) Transcript_3935:1809-2441(+)